MIDFPGEDPTPRADALVNYTLKVIARAQWSAFYHRKLDELPIKPARYASCLKGCTFTSFTH